MKYEQGSADFGGYGPATGVRISSRADDVAIFVAADTRPAPASARARHGRPAFGYPDTDTGIDAGRAVYGASGRIRGRRGASLVADDERVIGRVIREGWSFALTAHAASR